MDKLQHILCVIAEECTEIGKAASKGLRFGTNDVNPNTLEMNVTDLYTEYYELQAMFGLLNEELFQCRLPAATVDHRRIMNEKLKRFHKYLGYSAEKGTYKP